MSSIGERIKKARMAHTPPLSQSDVARRAGVSQSTVGNLEAGIRKRPMDIVGIAAALGVSSEWLSTGEGSMNGGARQPIEWPFELLSREQWLTLSERQRGAVEAGALRALEEVRAHARGAAGASAFKAKPTLHRQRRGG